MMEWMGDPRVSQYMHWETITTREAALGYLKNTIFPHPWYRSICLDGKPIGYVSVQPGAGDGRCRAEASACVARKYWGRGILPAAGKMAARAAFMEFPHLERLDALVAVENKRSQRGSEKIGFVREVVQRKYCIADGKAKDVVRYVLLREEKSKL